MIHPTAVIYPGVEIAEDVCIGPYSIIGAPPEHREFYDGKKGSKGVKIERGARISSHVTIDAGTINQTVVGECSAIFQHSHVGHDCIIGAGVTIGGKCSLAGHTIVMDGATISGHSCTFQRIVVGAYAFIGGMSFITRDIPCAKRFAGYRPLPMGTNEVGLERASLTYSGVLDRYQSIYEGLINARDN